MHGTTTITSEMLKIEASRVGDPALEQMVAVLEGDMKAVARRVAATIAPPDEEEECEPPRHRRRGNASCKGPRLKSCFSTNSVQLALSAVYY